MKPRDSMSQSHGLSKLLNFSHVILDDSTVFDTLSSEITILFFLYHLKFYLNARVIIQAGLHLWNIDK